MKNLKVAIYARVSTTRQNAEIQTRELEEYIKRMNWTLYRSYVDNGYTGKNTSRPAYREMMKAATRKEFDILLVWKFDRMSRSIKDLISTLDELRHHGIDFISYENNIDTSSPTGKLLFHFIGAFAEFERELIRERVMAGLENAKIKGKKLGRPSVKNDFIIDKAKAMRASGMSFRAIAKELRVSDGTVRNILKKKK